MIERIVTAFNRSQNAFDDIRDAMDNIGYPVSGLPVEQYADRIRTLEIDVGAETPFDRTWSDSVMFNINFQGAGTATDPFRIETASHLAGMMMLCNRGPSLGALLGTTAETLPWRSAHYILTNDISLRNARWFPICSTTALAFVGSFDGEMHTIEMPRFIENDGSLFTGLFGSIGTNGRVRNLELVGDVSVLSATATYGALAGSATTGVNGVVENIINRSNASIVFAPNSSASSTCGAVFGVGGGTLRNIVNYGNIHATRVFNCGNFMGQFSGNTSTVVNCINFGTLTADVLTGTGNANGSGRFLGHMGNPTNSRILNTVEVGGWGVQTDLPRASGAFIGLATSGTANAWLAMGNASGVYSPRVPVIGQTTPASEEAGRLLNRRHLDKDYNVVSEVFTAENDRPMIDVFRSVAEANGFLPAHMEIVPIQNLMMIHHYQRLTFKVKLI